MSSPLNPYVASHSSGRAISPPLSDSSAHDARRSTDLEDRQLEQDLDAARQMSMARGRDSSPPRHTRLRRISNAPRYDDAAADAIEPYFREGMMNRSPTGFGPRSAIPANGPSHAARFYQHHRRTGSNTSLDSQQHFIDHRNQAHSLSAHPQSQSPLALRERASVSRNPVRSHIHNHTAHDAHAPADAQDDDHATEGDALLHTPGARSPTHAHAHPHPHPQPDLYGGHSASSPRTLSRRPSLIEDDVCFPMHDPHQDAELAASNQDHGRYDTHHTHDDAYHHHETGAVPPGYPFNFDLSALEDFAAEERERLGMASSFASANANDNQGLRIRRPSAQKASGPAYGFSPDSDDATFYSRRPRKLSATAGALGSSKYQRKLALFEGAGGAPPPVAGAGATTSILGNGALLSTERSKSVSDAKTPLLDKDTLPSYHGTHDGASRPGFGTATSQGGISAISAPPAPGRTRSQTGLYSNSEKPYRFTFYSNALPSTIHARHLAELPAEGQTFEQLFSGRSSNHNQDASPSPAPQESAPGSEGPNASRTGSQAPSRAPSRAPTLNAKTAGLGRMEGTTAPPTGANTPLQAIEAQMGGGSGKAPMGGLSGLSGLSAGMAAAMQAAAGRALPGGGIRMDQDPEANTWWLDVLSPTDQEMKLLSRVFGIHPLTTEDILMEETREKIELFRNYYLVCFRSFDQDPYSPTYLEPLNMYIIVFREGTLSFHFRGTPHPQNVRRRIKQLKDYINVTSDWISYALIDDITDAFGPLIQSIEYEVDSIDELVLILKEAEQSDMLRRIGTCRKKVMGLLRLMGNKADVVKGLAKRCNENWSVAPKSDIGLYLSDIQDHLITMTQNLNHYEKILSRSHSNYLAQISIEMTDANNQINDVLSKLTALGTVIVPMNVITGLWGMNVTVPGEGIENLHWFGGICSVMVVLAVTGYIATTRYLERSR